MNVLHGAYEGAIFKQKWTYYSTYYETFSKMHITLPALKYC